MAILLLVGTGVTIWLVLDPTGSSPHPVDPGKSDHPVSTSTTPATRSVSSSTTQPVSAVHPDPLSAPAAAYLGARIGTVLAGVEDLDTDQTWTYGQGGPQDEASIVKLDVLEALLARDTAEGQALSSQDRALSQTMIEDSDNTATTDLWEAVGSAPGMRAFNDQLGLNDTTPSTCVMCPGFPWPGWGLSTTTPEDQLQLLREVVEPNAVFTADDRSFALDLLENVTPDQRWGVSSGVSPNATVALKNGWLPLNDADSDWQINSIGWVSGDGRNYLVAVLTTGNPSEAYGIDTIDQLSALVWTAMG
jgi:beta-lactamase class A